MSNKGAGVPLQSVFSLQYGVVSLQILPVGLTLLCQRDADRAYWSQ